MIRKARLTDIEAIHALIKPFAAEEVMLPLSLGEVTERLRDFLVAEEEGRLMGTVAVHVMWGTLVEVRSLAVDRSHRGQGLGRQLVEAAHAEARELGAEEVFVLTYIPPFFESFGYSRISRDQLPHKVWLDCVKCPKFPDCGEVAMKRSLP